MTLDLLVRSPEGEIQRYCQPGTCVVVGRDPGCDVVLPSPEVSRRHLVLAWEQDRVLVTDTSANGTSVSGRILRRASELLPPATPLSVGPFEVRV